MLDPTQAQQFLTETENLGTLIYQGAEARLYKTQLYTSSHPISCIIKERFIKQYRHPLLDLSLTSQRIRAEVRQLLRCRQIGIDVPSVLLVDIPKHRIWLGEIGPDASTLHVWFGDILSDSEQYSSGDKLIQVKEMRLRNMASALGRLIAHLHSNHIIHGDLTMANILVRKPSEPEIQGTCEPSLVPIDFGLSTTVSNTANQRLAEDKAVDLYVFERALACAIDRHALQKIAGQYPDLATPEAFVEQILQSYKRNYPALATEYRDSVDLESGSKSNSGKSLQECLDREVEDILKRLEDVRMRGRKRLMIG